MKPRFFTTLRKKTDTSARLNICAIVFGYYPWDVRVRREAETLAEKGFAVDLICLRDKDRDMAAREKINDVSVYRLNMQRKRRSKFSYIFQYFEFMIRVFARLNRLDWRQKYDAIHIHNMPDVLVFSVIIQKLTGAKIVLDMHDPMPEIYVTKFGIPMSHPVIRLITWFEKQSIAFSDVVLTTNVAFKRVFVDRGCPPEKIHIIMNSPKPGLFKLLPEGSTGGYSNPENGFRIMFHGTLIKRHGLRCALQALTIIRDRIPGLAFHVYGRGEYAKEFIDDIRRYNLQHIVTYHGSIPNSEIAAAISEMDLGIIPNMKTPFTEINFPVRIFEYLAMKCPVIVPETTGIRDYFSESDIHFFEAGNPQSLAKKILDIYLYPEQQDEILQNGFAIYSNHTWNRFENYFRYIFASIIAGEQPVQDRFVPDAESDEHAHFTEKKMIID